MYDKDLHLDPSPFIRGVIANDPNATKEQLDKLIRDEDISVVVISARNPNLTEDQLDILICSRHHNVRYTAARHPNATKEQLDKLLEDEDEDVAIQHIALKNPNADPASVTYYKMKWGI